MFDITKVKMFVKAPQQQQLAALKARERSNSKNQGKNKQIGKKHSDSEKSEEQTSNSQILNSKHTSHHSNTSGDSEK